MVEQEPARSRSGSPETRRALVDAARVLVMQRRDGGASMGAIAGAGVDAVMVNHCPGDTERVFQAVLELPVNWPDLLAGMTPTGLGRVLQNGIVHTPCAGSAPQLEARTGGSVS